MTRKIPFISVHLFAKVTEEVLPNIDLDDEEGVEEVGGADKRPSVRQTDLERSAAEVSDPHSDLLSGMKLVEDSSKGEGSKEMDGTSSKKRKRSSRGGRGGSSEGRGGSSGGRGGSSGGRGGSGSGKPARKDTRRGQKNHHGDKSSPRN